MDILIEDVQGSLMVAAVEKRQLQGLDIDPDAEIVRWGSVYWARVTRIDAGLNCAFLDLGHGFTGMLNGRDIWTETAKETPPQKRKVQNLLRSGQMIAVQIKTARNPIDEHDEDRGRTEHKASRVSMDISLPGRYMIFAPLMDGNRVSRRISDTKLRSNLTKMMKSVDDISGCILRASAANCQTEILIREGKILKAIWDSLREYMEGETPALLMLGPDAIQRALSDQSNTHIDKIIVTTPEHYDECYDWCDLYAPEMLARIEDLSDDEDKPDSLLDHYGLIPALDELVQRYVVLPSGGFIVIQETSALIAIDVNSGSDRSQHNANIEAADEIARQLRIRNLGGTIIVDFINEAGKAQKAKLLDRMKKAAETDPCTINIHGWTKLNLIEISRQRRTPTLLDRLRMLNLVEEQETHL